ncbi:MAG TPA: hypothetical protein VHH36_08000, partial [Candidatus Thermoplasmatota archaeon]|nr:hypothetical protein [Candidatus Thermoplasmatota archaeon]
PMPARMAPPAVVLLPAAVQVASGALYLWVARIVLRRRVEGDARLANALFATWWIALGLVFLAVPAYSVATRTLGARDLALAVTFVNVVLLLVVVAVWGLVYYLVYLYTGSQRAFWPVSAFYVAFSAVVLYLVAWMQPNGFDDEGTLTFVRERLTGAPAVALGLLFSLPVVLAALAYGSLFFRVRDPAPRYRIGLVAGAFLLQFGWSVVSTALQLPQRYPDSLALSLLSNALGVVAAVSVLLAFKPPRAVRERLALGAGSAH